MTLLFALCTGMIYYGFSENPIIAMQKAGKVSFIFLNLPFSDLLSNFLFVFGNFILIILIVTLLYLLIRRQFKDPFPELIEKLTKKEREVVLLIQDDLSNKEIANHLYICPSTVKTHINNIFKKLNLRSRKELKRITLK